MCRLTATGIPPAEAAKAAMRAAQESRTEAPPAPVGEGRPEQEPLPATSQPSGGGGLPLGEVRQECRGLARAAVRLDAAAVHDALAAAIADHGLMQAWEEIMMPALRAVGRKWASSGERYVEVEHLLSWQVSAALRGATAKAQHTATTSVPGTAQVSAPIVLACVPGELHSLPLEALAAAAGQHGMPVLMFGAAVPVPALEEAVRRTGPAVVVLWSQSRSSASRPLAQHIAGMAWGVRGARRCPAVVAAGPGWAGAHMPDMHRPHGLRQAVILLRELAAP
jgi:MerR family transcriptional regulator, light-induced transcriptional regulator